jgi:hypothetical protein
VLRGKLTIEEAKRIVAAVTGPPTRKLEGEEYKLVLLALDKHEPVYSSNSQRFFTEKYIINNKTYVVTTGDGIGETEIEEILDEN